MEKLPVSLVIITLNEEKNIERCIKSALWCNDIVVVDSFSSDKTPDVARNLGARVYSEKWRGYGEQKNFGMSLALNDWVLSLDADEALSPELSEELKKTVAAGLNGDAYECRRRSWYMGRWIYHGGWYPDLQARFFNRTAVKWSASEVHERLIAKSTLRLNSELLHWPFQSLAHQIEKNNKYSSLGALEQKKLGVRFSLFKLIFKPVVKFFETYFLKRGFLDGLPGFIIAVGAGYSVHLKMAKLYELEKKDV
ncbi:MAG: glycosyltransferase family 2 protein [Pseudomonadota bacterium]|nr:glycosyltransferase family 2 protein [Pseudomonadota bacterium]